MLPGHRALEFGEYAHHLIHGLVEVAARRILAEFVERGPQVAALGAADAFIAVDFDNLVAYAVRDRAQFALLVRRSLMIDGVGTLVF